MLVFGQLVFCCLLARDGAFGKGQLVGRSRCGFLVFDPGLHRAADRALCRCHFGSGGHCCEFAAECVEVTALCRQNLAGFARWRSQCGCLVRHLQHGTCLDPVDVALDEGAGVGAQQRHQHLVQRYAGRAVGIGQAAGRIPRLDGDAFGRSRAWAGRCGVAGRACGGRRRIACNGRCRALLGLRPHHGGRDLRRRGDCGRRAAQSWRIEQHGVAAHDVAAAPRGIENQVHERVVDGAVAGQTQHGRAVGAALQLYPQIVHHRVELHALGAKDFGRGGGGTQGVRLLRRDLGQVDFGAQWLTESRLHRNAAQSEGASIVGMETGQRDGGSRQNRKFPTMHMCHQMWWLCGSVERHCSSHGLVPPRRVKICKKHHSINVLHRQAEVMPRL